MDTRATSVPEAYASVREFETPKKEESADRTTSETKPWMIVYAVTLGILFIPAVVLPVLTAVVALSN